MKSPGQRQPESVQVYCGKIPFSTRKVRRKPPPRDNSGGLIGGSQLVALPRTRRLKGSRSAYAPDASAFQDRIRRGPAPRHEERLRLEGRRPLRAPLD